MFNYHQLGYQHITYIKILVNYGCIPALRQNKSLCNGLNIYKGSITHTGVADSIGMDYVFAEDAIA